MITAGDDRDNLGVFSVSLGRMITPTEFDCIDYGDKLISCEVQYTCEDKYYDYDGNKLPFDAYDHVFEHEGLLNAWKGGKLGVIDWSGKVIIPFVLQNGTDTQLKYYKKGYLVVCSGELKGLSRTNGDVILPEIYSDISFCGDYVVASVRNNTNWIVRDTLFTIDGKPLLEGPYRRIRIKEGGVLTAETPQGLVHFSISSFLS